MKPVSPRSAIHGRPCLILVIGILAVAAHPACRDSTPPPESQAGRPKESGEPQKPAELEGGKLKETVETQKTINRYFQNVVIPKLAPCWDRLQGTGTIAMKFVFARAAEGWTGSTVEAGESALSPDQTAAATKCMQGAVQGTTLPLPPRGDIESYELNWTWPVQLPPDAAAQFARMQNESGGLSGTGCDGHGAVANCVTCVGLDCIRVCVGGKPPCTITANPLPGGLNTCTVGTGCASGGLFGVVGAQMF